MWRKPWKPLACAASAGLAAFVAYDRLLRPWARTWGAGKQEAAKRWPGDAFLPAPAMESTRAVTIAAPADKIWAWILQLGQDRAGFYSYSWLENLLGANIHNLDYVVPEFQRRAVGDTVWMAPEEKFEGQGRMIVALLEPERAMILVSPSDWDSIRTGGKAQESVWSFILDPVDADSTRLVMRSRSGPKATWRAKLIDYLFWEPAHFVMERKMMLTIKENAERTGHEQTPETELVRAR